MELFSIISKLSNYCSLNTFLDKNIRHYYIVPSMGNLRWRDQRTKTLQQAKANAKSTGQSNTEPLHNFERMRNLREKIKEMKSKQNIKK
jgi:hypothetical protein